VHDVIVLFNLTSAWAEEEGRKPKRPGSMHAPLRRPGTNGSVKESELLSKEN
jgi:hypothetical protein